MKKISISNIPINFHSFFLWLTYLTIDKHIIHFAIVIRLKVCIDYNNSFINTCPFFLSFSLADDMIIAFWIYFFCWKNNNNNNKHDFDWLSVWIITTTHQKPMIMTITTNRHYHHHRCQDFCFLIDFFSLLLTDATHTYTYNIHHSNHLFGCVKWSGGIVVW